MLHDDTSALTEPSDWRDAWCSEEETLVDRPEATRCSRASAAANVADDALHEFFPEAPDPSPSSGGVELAATPRPAGRDAEATSRRPRQLSSTYALLDHRRVSGAPRLVFGGLFADAERRTKGAMLSAAAAGALFAAIVGWRLASFEAAADDVVAQVPASALVTPSTQLLDGRIVALAVLPGPEVERASPRSLEPSMQQDDATTLQRPLEVRASQPSVPLRSATDSASLGASAPVIASASLPPLAASPQSSESVASLAPAPLGESVAPPVLATATAAPMPAAASGANPTDIASAAAPTDRQAIDALLGRYQTAFSQRDASAARAIWPSVDADALVRAFEHVERQSVSFDSCAVAIAGTGATAECRGRTRYVPKVGSRTERTDDRQWQIDLVKADAGWQIVAVDSRD